MFTKQDVLTRVKLLPIEDAPTTEVGFIVDANPEKVLVMVDRKYWFDHFLEDGLRMCNHEDLREFALGAQIR